MSTNAVAKIDKIDFTKEQLQVIESQFFPAGASQAEQQYCFAVARELGLNPITREVYFVPRRQKVGDKWVNKVEPMVGRDGFLAIAHKSGQLAGIESSAGIRDIPVIENGKWTVKPQLVAECIVWRKDSSKPFTSQVAYSEYCQKTADGSPTKFWAEKPETMLKKVAESQALRKAFNIHGVFSPEEMGAGIEMENGDIITLEVETSGKLEADKSRLSIVKPPAPESPAPRPAPVIENDETEWPDPPGQNEESPVPADGVVSGIISILEGRHIAYDIDMEAGIISAKSYNERQLLKDNGFKWNADTKSWVFQFDPDPF